MNTRTALVTVVAALALSATVATVPAALAPIHLQASQAAASAREVPRSRFARVDGTRIVDPDGRPILLRGIGLGNWLLAEGYMFRFDDGPESERQIRALVSELVGPDEARAFWRTWRDRYVTREDIGFLKRIGLNSIRVPFNYRLLTPEDSPGTWLEDGFEVLDRIVAWAREEGLWVVLDMHAAPGGQTGENIDDSWGRPWLFTSEASQQRFVEIWTRIASRYRDEPTVLAYELLNEPLPHWDELRQYDRLLEPLYRRAVKGIRAIDPDHIVVLGGSKWNRDFSVFGKPFDRDLVYAFHKYWDEVTKASIQPYLDFRETHQVPVWLGEAGENNDTWVRDTVRLAEANDVGWCFWPYKKMEKPSAVVSFDRPAHWDDIVMYARLRGGTFEERRKARPPVEIGRAALQDLLEKIQLSQCRVNAGYVRALGMTP